MITIFAAVALALVPSQAGDTVRYSISFPNAVHHEARVEMTLSGLGRDTAEVWMSRSSPGRYALHEFAKNVYDLQVTSGAGRELEPVVRDPYRWFVGGHDGTIVVRYTLFADRADGTYSGIDLTHAHLNMPATFVWARGAERRPISVRFEVPEESNWRAATQLIETPDPYTFKAPDLQYLMDSPTELSDYELRTWTVPAPRGRSYTIRLAMHHLGTDQELDRYAEMAKKVVAEQIAIYGEPAPYDHGTYTFIADYLPWVSGDGMEHRNSTILSSTGDLRRNGMGLLGTLSHEFFHSWNIERIRPRSLEPFDFTRANPSDLLWLGEGFTSYYDDLTIRRAGLIDDATYTGGLGGLVNAVIHSPARRYRSPRGMSLYAPFSDAATSVDPTNQANTFLSYYTWGAGVGLGLDLTIRSRFAGKSLDGFMKAMWERFGRNDRPYVVARPYTVQDAERALGDYLGDRGFASDFFARYVRGRDVVDYQSLLEHAGFLLRRSNPDQAFLGLVQLRFGSDGAEVMSATLEGSPLYEAGVDRGDRIVSIGGRPLRSDADWQAIKSAQRPGGAVEIVYDQRGARQRATLQVVDDPRLEIVPFEAVGRAVTGQHRAFRSLWLGSKARR
ncbi:MAG: PDZ domain-containing protein [Gemmatimonadales bacterium]